MTSGPATTTPFYLSTLFQSGTFAGLSDREFLERFTSRHDDSDESAELAFTTLVARHGPMVLRVCHAVLPDRHEAEDAFQATSSYWQCGSARSGDVSRLDRGCTVWRYAWPHGTIARGAKTAT